VVIEEEGKWVNWKKGKWVGCALSREAHLRFERMKLLNFVKRNKTAL